MGSLIAVALSLAIILPLGWGVRFVGKRARIPAALSLMFLGIILGPEFSSLLSSEYLAISGHLSKMAFVILLVRAGLGLTPELVKKYLLPAFYLGIIPLLVEGTTLAWLGKELLFSSWPLALLFAAVLMCESPAIIFPTMLKVRHKNLGTEKGIPDKLMAKTLANILIAQSAILFFVDYLTLPSSSSDSLWAYYLFPLNVALGFAISVLITRLIPWCVLGRSQHPASTHALTALLLLVAALTYFGLRAFKIENIVATVFVSIFAFRAIPERRPSVDTALLGVWSFFEIILFVNLGAQIRLGALGAGKVLFIIVGVLVVAHALRQAMLVWILKSTHYSQNESFYIGFAHIPKATMQAVFGAVPLMAFTEAGLTELIPAGELILMAAVTGIILTAPPGALMLDNMAPRLLDKQSESQAPSSGSAD